MEPHNRGIGSEDEWFARREGEREREREERAKPVDTAEPTRPSAVAPTELPSAHEPAEGADTASRLVATMSTALKALFGISGRRRAHR